MNSRNVSETSASTSGATDATGPAGRNGRCHRGRCGRGRNGPRGPRRWIARGLFAFALFGALALACQAFGHGRHGPWERSMDDKDIARVVDHAIGDASDAQKAKVTAIVRDAVGQLRPLRDQAKADRNEAMKILAAPTVDRTALEAVRSHQLTLADQASRRITTALADAADVLTPEQRLKLAERVRERWADDVR